MVLGLDLDPKVLALLYWPVAGGLFEVEGQEKYWFVLWIDLYRSPGFNTRPRRSVLQGGVSLSVLGRVYSGGSINATVVGCEGMRGLEAAHV